MPDWSTKYKKSRGHGEIPRGDNMNNNDEGYAIERWVRVMKEEFGENYSHLFVELIGKFPNVQVHDIGKVMNGEGCILSDTTARNRALSDPEWKASVTPITRNNIEKYLSFYDSWGQEGGARRKSRKSGGRYRRMRSNGNRRYKELIK